MQSSSLSTSEIEHETSLLEGLNDRQREAVTTTDGPLLVLAGAGSGKTRVLVTRIAHLVNTLDVPPEKILGITFTRKVAEEMRGRLAESLGPETASKVMLSTFHGLGVSLLREFGVAAGLPGRFGIADESDTGARIRIVLKRLGVPRNAPGERPGEVEHRIQVAKAAFGNLLARQIKIGNDAADQAVARYRAGDPEVWEQIAAKINAPCLERFQEQFAAYQNALVLDNVVDYADLIVLPLLVFLERPEILRLAAAKWNYILVDEYQDTDYTQDHLLRLLVEQHRNLCVVGDDDQSIYSFRGAKVENIRTFPQRYSPCSVVKLDENYRSSPIILEAANASLAAHPEPGRLPKELWTRRLGGCPLRVWICGSQEVEANGVAEDITAALNSGEIQSYDDVMILYRVNAISVSLERALRNAQIPYRMVGGAPLHERKEVRDLIAYLKLVDNPFDTVSFERAVGTPARGIGPATVESMVGFARVQDITMIEAAQRAEELPGLRRKQREGLLAFAALLSELTRIIGAEGLTSAMQHLVETTGIRARLIEDLARLEAEEDEEGYEQALRKVQNIDEFMLYLEGYCRKASLLQQDAAGNQLPPDILQGFLQEVASLSPSESASPEEHSTHGAVTMMTVHSAKGLEAKRVYVVGLEERVFPTSDRDAEQLAEEARLFYVAITRAREQLILSSSFTRELTRENPQAMARSRFLASLPETVYRFERRI